MSDTAIAVRPSEVLGVDQPVPEWDGDGCPNCGNLWHKGPEAANWYRGHCWKCGYNPQVGMLGAPHLEATKAQWSALQSLVEQAVSKAFNTPQQYAAEQLARELGPEGLRNLAAQEQARLGTVQQGPDDAQVS